MKKFLILMLSLALAVCALTGAIAEETSWYEVTDESVLTVRLPVNGGEWAYEISDPDTLELITKATRRRSSRASRARSKRRAM